MFYGHQFPVQLDVVASAPLARDIIKLHPRRPRHLEQPVADNGTSLVNAITHRVYQITEYLLDLVRFNILLHHNLIDIIQLLQVSTHPLKIHSFGMNQEKQEHGLGQARHLHFLVRIIKKKNARFFINVNTAYHPIGKVI